MSRWDNAWAPYVPVAERRRRAAQKIAKMKKAGQTVLPVVIEGRRITTTFWGDAWGGNLEAYSDFANRLERGRTYVRNGSVVDLQVEGGRVRSMVSGSELYTVQVDIKQLDAARWGEIKGQCAGQIGSLVELLRGSISKSVMEVVTRKGGGLFPAPKEIRMKCSCPDYATMCKHVAATLYGVGARLDHDPASLFTLRGVDPSELIEAALAQPRAASTASTARRGRVLDAGALSDVFGVDFAAEGVAAVKEAPSSKAPAKRGRRAAVMSEEVAKPAVKKAAVAKKSVAKKPPAKKAAVKKAPAKKAPAKKAPAKKAPAKRPLR